MITRSELFDVLYRFYPREIHFHDPRYEESAEHHRLVAARREAGAARGAWQDLIRRFGDVFPGRGIHDNVLSCPAEWLKTSYRGWIDLPTAPDEHARTVAFQISFLAPCYVIYATRTTDDLEAMEARRAKHRHTVLVGVEGVCWALPRDVVAPDVLAQVDRELAESPPARRREIRFELSPDERSYALSIARDIEATWGYECMPPEIGKVIVPDVATNRRGLGEATLYDCLLSEDS
jgi:hypothetical protein